MMDPPSGIDLSKKLLSGPVTALESVTISSDTSVIFRASSCLVICSTLSCINCTSTNDIDVVVFETQNILGLKCLQVKHDLSCHMGQVAAFGDKSLSILEWSYDSVRNTPLHVKKLCAFESLDDLVLDCSIAKFNSSSAKTLILIGYAHNFVDVLDLSVAISSTQSFQLTRLLRLECPVRCVLFSLSFAPPLDNYNTLDDGLMVASGTAFGKILLWKIRTLNVDISDLRNSHVADIHRTLHGHEGVVFKIRWSIISKEGSTHNRIASVSDDRTVRIWDVNSGTLLYVGWGHISRLWDVAFLHSKEFNHSKLEQSQSPFPSSIVTCSEDGTVKLWNLPTPLLDSCDPPSHPEQLECLCTMRGHASDVWCIVSAIEDKVVISGGNDSLIRIWPLSSHMVSSSERFNPFPVSFLPIPDWNSSLPLSYGDAEGDSKISSEYRETEGTILSDQSEALADVEVRPEVKSSRRQNGVCALKLSPNCQWLVVILVDGKIWMKRHDCNEAVSKIWHQLCDLRKGTTGADVYFPPTNASSAFVVVAHPDGSISQVYVNMLNDKEGEKIEKREPNNFFVRTHTFYAHSTRVINLWCVSSLHSVMVVTASTQGSIRVWQISPDQITSWQEQSVISDPLLLFSFVTGRQLIATCVCVCSGSKIINAKMESQDWLAVGDVKGGISFFELSNTHDVNSIPHVFGKVIDHKDVAPQHYIHHAHGKEAVSAICALRIEKEDERREETLCSLGHDGYLNLYRLTLDLSSSYPFQSHYKIYNRISTLPIKSPLHVFLPTLPSAYSNTSIFNRLYIGGFTGSTYFVIDLNKIQIMRVKGGGWKRPHTASLVHFLTPPSPAWSDFAHPSPRVAFVCACPVGSTSTTLQIIDSYSLSNLSSHRALSFDPTLTTPSALSLPTAFGTPSLGRVGYCGVMMDARFEREEGSWIIVGGEEGSIKVLFAPNTKEKSAHSAIQGTSDLILHQEVFMSQNASVKSLSVAFEDYQEDETHYKGRKSGRGIIIGGGGKLGYCVWTFSLGNSAMHQLLSIGCEGTTWKHATQDHRILSTSCSFLYSNLVSNFVKSTYLITLSDSRGHVFLCRCECDYADYTSSVSRTNFQIIEEVIVGSSPIVASDIQVVSCDGGERSRDIDQHRVEYAFGVFGDTSGIVSLWFLPHSSSPEGPTKVPSPNDIPSTSLCILSYEAHSMGSNAVSFRMRRCDQLKKKVEGEIKEEWEFFICSGGDDQAISLCKGVLSFDESVR